MAKKHCETCGAAVVEYKHGLGKGLARCLYRLARAGGGPINLNDLKLNISQQTNFYKLRYWNLVEKSDPNCAKGGVWNLTEHGKAFVAGEVKTSKHAVTYRGVLQYLEGADVSIRDITDGWWYRPDYVRESRAHV